MSKRKEYSAGDIVGYNNVVFLKYTSKDKNNKWKALFQCPLCGNEFESLVNNVAKKTNGVKSCGCSKRLNIQGQRFGRLIALHLTTQRIGTGVVWECQCDCGKKHYATTHALKRGDTNSCGCLQKENGHIQGLKHKKDLSNQKFGKLTVLKCTNKKNNSGAYLWYCQCDCGNFCEVCSTDLIGGHTQSCGCLLSQGEQVIKNILQELDIKYQAQKTFEGCKNPQTNTKLRFDFYLPKYNCCIEYDGIQHFIQQDKRWIREDLHQIQYRDEIKNLYCQNNNIHLIRIPYTELNKINKDYLLDKIKNI